MVKKNSGRLPAPERRAQILQCALREFAAAGYGATSTRELATAAGVTEPVLYRHFRGKEDLFAAVLADVAERLAIALEAALATGKGARARIEALAAALPDLLDRFGPEFRLLCGAAAAPGGKVQIAATRAAVSRLETTIAKALGGPHLRKGIDPELAASFLLQVGLGHALVRPLAPQALARADIRERMVDLLVGGLL